MPFDLNWLMQQPAPPETTKPETPALLTSGGRTAVQAISYGSGLVAPFRRDGKGDFVHAADITLVRSNLMQVLHTIGSSGSTVGEIPWRPEFGSLLHLLRYRNLDETTIALAQTHVLDAIKRWLPRVRVKKTTALANLAENSLTLTVHYDILSSTKRSVLASNVSDSVAVPIAA